MTIPTQCYTTNGAASTQGQNAVSKWLEDKVLYCQSGLVSEVLNEYLPITSKSYGWDWVENLYDDSMEAVEEYLTYSDRISDEEREEVWQLPFDEREAMARQLGWEPEPKEIYEWWLVSGHFAARLREAGEPILAAYSCTWWGRCCAGQWLGMDKVIVGLFNEIDRNQLKMF